MAWETRKGRAYYYAKRREGKKVVSVYCGNGAFAQLVAESSANQAEERNRLRSQIKEEETLWQQMCKTDQDVQQLCKKVLEEAGFHRLRNGQWRRKGRPGRLPKA